MLDKMPRKQISLLWVSHSPLVLFILSSRQATVFVTLMLMQLVGVVQGQVEEEADNSASPTEQQTAAAAAAPSAVKSNAMDVEEDGMCIYLCPASTSSNLIFSNLLMASMLSFIDNTR